LSTDTPPIDRLEVTGKIRAVLNGLMEMSRYEWNEQGAMLIHGRLLKPAEAVYRQIRAGLRPLGFTPFLERKGEEDTLQAIPFVVEHTTPRVRLPVLLFAITIVTALIAGSIYNQNLDYIGALPEQEQILASFGASLHTLTNTTLLLKGLPFAFTLLSILLAHEMGHYVVGRLRGAPVSLPYFIPLPPPLSFTGTMGAVIVQHEPMEDRRTILEIGLAGPFAGLLLAIPLLIYGLSTSTVGPPPAGGYTQEGNSLLYAGLKWLVFGRFLPGGGVDVQLNDIAWGAWIGLLITMLNLLPVGQFDGGHAAYALLGDNAQYLAYGIVGLCIALGLTMPNGETWLIWSVLVFLVGLRHPPPLNDITRLGPWHIALAIAGLLTLVLLFMPAPLVNVQLGG
jgi:Zn-dependent protease